MKKTKLRRAVLLLCLVFFGFLFCISGCATMIKSNNEGYVREWKPGDEGVRTTVATLSDGVWKAPVISGTQTITEGTLALVEALPLSSGYYRFSAEMLIDSSVSDNYIIGEFRVFDKNNGDALLGYDMIKRRDFAKDRTYATLSMTFIVPQATDADLEIKFLNRSEMWLKSLRLEAIGMEEHRVLDVERTFFDAADEQQKYDGETLYYIDLYQFFDPLRDSALAYDIGNFVTTLQGLVNRNGQHLYVNFNGPNSFLSSTENFWLEYLQQEGQLLHGKRVVEIKKPGTLLELFRDSFEGFAVWDNDVPATVNAAATACGVENLLPLRYSDKAGSLYDILIRERGYEVKLDLHGKFDNSGRGKIWQTNVPATGSAKNDAYLWAKSKYLDTGLVNPTLMANHLDAFSWDKSGKVTTYYELQQQYLSNRDYYIQNKAFFFDLMVWENYIPNDDPGQEMGTDYSTLCRILDAQYQLADGEIISIGGFVPWWIKYTDKAAIAQPEAVATEWQAVTVFTRYNAVIDADAYAYTGLGNASVYSKVPQIEYRQKADVSDLAIERKMREYLNPDGSVKAKNYVMVYMGDFDSAAWAANAFPKFLNDPMLGTFPIAWPINPQIARRNPLVFNYLYEHATENDYFVGDHNGVGYYDPHEALSGMAKDPNDFDSFMQTTRELWEKYDIDLMGFLLTFSQPTREIAEAYAEIAPKGIVSNYSYDTELVNGVPFVMHTYLEGTSADDVANMMNALMVSPQDTGVPAFHAFRYVLKSPSYIAESFRLSAQKDPSLDIEIVDPYTFMALYKVFYSGGGVA